MSHPLQYSGEIMPRKSHFSEEPSFSDALEALHLGWLPALVRPLVAVAFAVGMYLLVTHICLPELQAIIDQIGK